MTDDLSLVVPTSLTNDKKSSSWNFDDLNNEDDENNSNDFFSVLKNNISKNVYLDQNKKTNKEKSSTNKINQRSTIRIDSSDLITRCKDFLPLLTDANRNLFSKMKSGENVRIELDSDDDNNEKTIEMNIMFCPNIDSSSESDDEQIKSTTLQINKKINSVNIVELQSDENVNN